jgi:hypothetical protein
MLDILDAVWKDCYGKEFTAIRALILAAWGWKRQAKDALDESMYSGECQGLVELAEEIRDFGVEVDELAPPAKGE